MSSAAPAIGAYTSFLQYILGPGYTSLPGNNERLFPICLFLFTAGWMVALGAWRATPTGELHGAGRRQRGIGLVLAVLGFVTFVRYVPALADWMSASPEDDVYLAGPGFAWTIATLDLGVFLPATVAACIGLCRSSPCRSTAVEQGMVIRGEDASNPILLWVHGGPGMPDYPLTQQYPPGVEGLFTVAWWDQRGAALSYHSDIAPETMTIEQFIDDTLAVTDYLRRRFHQDRIYILGHSWGSFIAVQAAARSPERHKAYLGMAQVVHQLESERSPTTTCWPPTGNAATPRWCVSSRQRR